MVEAPYQFAIAIRNLEIVSRMNGCDFQEVKLRDLPWPGLHDYAYRTRESAASAFAVAIFRRSIIRDEFWPRCHVTHGIP
jgi:hypothetical protein